MAKYLKWIAMLSVPLVTSGCAWAVHTTSCVVTLTVVC